jgi:ribosomal protein S18 acetylase RimI-like enzyme
MFVTVDDLRFLAAGPGDADAIAALHADSWRRHYRGAFADDFLDGDVAAVLRDRWRARFATRDPRTRTILAWQDGELVGLAHTELGADPRWGALLDNLHVAYGMKRQGVGRRLVALTARAVIDAVPGSGLYLWVLDQNAAARAFYARLGGETVDSHVAGAPGGDSSRLNGSPIAWRIVWPDPAPLLADQKFSD